MIKELFKTKNNIAYLIKLSYIDNICSIQIPEGIHNASIQTPANFKLGNEAFTSSFNGNVKIYSNISQSEKYSSSDCVYCLGKEKEPLNIDSSYVGKDCLTGLEMVENKTYKFVLEDANNNDIALLVIIFSN